MPERASPARSIPDALALGFALWMMTLWLPGAFAVGTTVYRCNYDVRLEVAGEQHAVHHQDSVRAGSHIPINLSRRQLTIAFGELDGASVQVEVSLHVLAADGGLREALTVHRFAVPVGRPVTERWEEGEVSVDLALAVAVVRP